MDNLFKTLQEVLSCLQEEGEEEMTYPQGGGSKIDIDYEYKAATN